MHRHAQREKRKGEGFWKEGGGDREGGRGVGKEGGGGRDSYALSPSGDSSVLAMSEGTTEEVFRYAPHHAAQTSSTSASLFVCTFYLLYVLYSGDSLKGHSE